MRFFRNALSIFMTASLSLPLGLMAQLVLARWLSVDDRGIYAFLISVVAIAFLGGSLGWTAASIYRLRRLGADTRRVAGTGTLVNAMSAVAVTAVCWWARAPLCAAFVDQPVPDAEFGLAIAVVPFMVVGNYHRSLAQALDRFDLHNAYGFGQVALMLLLLTGLVVWQGQGLAGALAANLLANIALSIWLAARVLPMTGFEWRPDTSEIIGSLTFGLKSWILHVAVQLQERLGIFVVGALVGDPAQLAFFGIAMGTVSRLNLIPMSSAVAIFPKLAGDDPREAARFAVFVGRHSVLWVGVLVLGLVPVVPVLIPWVYGDAYSQAIASTLWLLPGMAGLTLARVISRYFMSQDRQGIVIAARLTSIAASIASCAWWVPLHGVAGAAAATTLGYGLEAGILLVAFGAVSGERVTGFAAFDSQDWDVYARRVSAVWARIRGAAGPGSAA